MIAFRIQSKFETAPKVQRLLPNLSLTSLRGIGADLGHGAFRKRRFFDSVKFALGMGVSVRPLRRYSARVDGGREPCQQQAATEREIQ